MDCPDSRGVSALLCIVMTACCAKDKNFQLLCLCMPFLFLLLHVTYGVGTWAGFFQLPFWKKKHHNGQSRRTEEIRQLLKKKKEKRDRV